MKYTYNEFRNKEHDANMKKLDKKNKLDNQRFLLEIENGYIDCTWVGGVVFVDWDTPFLSFQENNANLFHFHFHG